MPADILLYALVAAGLVFWLKTILGTRDEDEDTSDQSSIFSEDKNKKEDSFMAPLTKSKETESNVVSLDALVGRSVQALPSHVRIDNKTTENALEDLSAEYDTFDLHQFVGGAEYAFTMIIEAFAEGDLETLEDLLKPSVFSAFKEAIEQRNERGETVETEVKSVEKIDITQVAVEDDIFYLTVRFTAREVCVIRDKDGEIISGDPQRTTQMVDVWVFGRDMTSDGPEWYLYETRDDEIEDHKTPIPEGGKDKN